ERELAFWGDAALPIEPPVAVAAWSKSCGEFASAFSVWSTRFGSTYCDDPEKSCERSVGARMTCECATYCLPWLWRTRSNMTAPTTTKSTMIHNDRRRIAARVSMPSVFMLASRDRSDRSGRAPQSTRDWREVGAFLSFSQQKLSKNLLDQGTEALGQAPVGPAVVPQVK